MLDYLPHKCDLYNGQSVLLPWRSYRMFYEWKRYPHLAKESREAFDAYNGGDLLDIGAFHGWYSWLLAPKARDGDILASFEPDQKAYPSLMFNLSFLAQQFPELRILPSSLPVGNGAGIEVSFPYGPTGHPRFSCAAGGDGGTLRMDDFVENNALAPKFVKIDVEGAEFFVLEGMRQTLERHHPQIMLETHPQWQPDGIKVEHIHTLLTGYGYTSSDLDVSEIAIRQLWK